MSKENRPEDHEVLVRDVKLDEPFFLPEKEAKREEKAGNVVIVKEEKSEKTKA
jgi:hypothetical protein